MRGNWTGRTALRTRAAVLHMPLSAQVGTTSHNKVHMYLYIRAIAQRASRSYVHSYMNKLTQLASCLAPI